MSVDTLYYRTGVIVGMPGGAANELTPIPEPQPGTIGAIRSQLLELLSHADGNAFAVLTAKLEILDWVIKDLLVEKNVESARQGRDPFGNDYNELSIRSLHASEAGDRLLKLIPQINYTDERLRTLHYDFAARLLNEPQQ